MSEVAAGGRTVLFVSHNMNAVENLCTTIVCLEAGRVKAHGTDVRGVITRHLDAASENRSVASAWTNEGNRFDHPVMQPLYFAIEDSRGEPLTAPARNDAPLSVVIRANVRQLDQSLKIGFTLFNQDSDLLLSSMTTDGPEESWPVLGVGELELRCKLPTRFLNEGTYRFELNCSLHHREWIVRPGHNSPAVHLTIQGGLSDSPYWLSPRPGLLAPEWTWVRRG
jgi:lipopolysaccharide transport system ATP-binding protein